MIRKDGIRKTEWTDGYADYFPLPLLSRFAKANGFDLANVPWAAHLQLAAPVPTVELDPRRRVACLSGEGTHVLLQRLVFADTRVVVRTESLAYKIAPKLEELESLQTWNEDLVAPKVEAGADLDAELLAAATEFDGVCGATSDDRPVSIREMLESVDRRGEGHRLLMRELKERREATS